MRLREIATEDIDRLTQILNEKEVSRFMSYPSRVSKMMVEDWLNSITQNPNNIIFLIEDRDETVGCVRLERYSGKQKHVAKLRIWISNNLRKNN